jgi:outer membrane receptor protein involved in Fe transport
MTRSRRRKLQRLITAKTAGPARSRTGLLAGLPLAPVLLGGMSVASAQQSAPAGLEEIVVTAQKREESLQNVPISIQAIGTAKLEELHISNYSDYANFLPTLSTQNGGQAGGSGFQRSFMRGIASGETANHSGPAPSVGTYLDEQPITMISGAVDVHIYDIARVEALAGPQGTLYGASSQSGTIRIITNKPDPTKFEAGYDLEFNSVSAGDEGYVAEGFVNVPISDNAAIRLVGFYDETAGYIDNVHGTVTYPSSGITIDNAGRVEKNYNDGTKYGMRAALKIDLNDSWTITPSAMAQKSTSNGSFGYRATGEPFEIVRFNPEEAEDRWWQAALTVEGRFSNFNIVYAGAFLDRDDETSLDYVDYSYFYDCCYAYPVGGYIYDDAGDPIDITQFIKGKDRYTMLSQEIRISSDPEQRLRYVAGLFYNRQFHDIQQDYQIAGLASSLEVTGWNDAWWLTKQERTDVDKAIFGELSFDFTDRLTGTVGIRFFESDNTLQGFRGFGLTNGWTSGTGEKNPECALRPDDFNGAPCMNLNRTTNESGNTPKVNLTYKFTPDKLVYATYSEGFRPGGVNRVDPVPPYEADYVYNYELGWKTTWADNRLRFNGALFYEEWEDFQYSFLGPNSVTVIVNAGNAEITGLEADLTWAATENLTLSLGGAWVNAELTEDYCGAFDANLNPGCIDENGDPAAVQAPDGQQLPVTPKFKGNAIARYTFGIGTMDAYLQGAAAYVGSRWADLRTAQRDVLGEIPDYTIVNFSAGISRDSWTLELFANNAFDEEGQVDRWAQCDALICGETGTYITPTQPRTVGIKFGQKF